MLERKQVASILARREQGWSIRRIARALGHSRNTVRRYLRAGDALQFHAPRRKSCLDGRRRWLKRRFIATGGNATAVCKELWSKHRIRVSARTVQRAVASFRAPGSPRRAGSGSS